MKRADFIKKYSAKEYLGDGLFSHFDGYNFILSTQRHYDRDPEWDWVGLEPEVFDRFIQYRAQVYIEAETIED